MKYARRRFLMGLGFSVAGISLPLHGVETRVPERNTKSSVPVRDGVSIVPRATWSSESVYPDRLIRAKGFDRITIHHSARINGGETSQNSSIYELQTIQAGHLKRGYGDIGYHFVVDLEGRVWGGRSLVYEGAHVLRENRANVGIMLLGNFEKERPTSSQLAATHALIFAACKNLGIQSDRVYGHRDLGASACPGRHLYGHLNVLRGERGNTDFSSRDFSG
ncbi:MAG: N-acetylmuramoyl-L-alanine amidase [Kiritimatiellae bacterium]|nr:N-acetylmuramoyl-L-alanine amidase [Kiritimatiellia bacterium]